MQTNIQEIYRQNILPLSDSEQLKLASLILDKVTSKENGDNKPKKGRSIRELFGKGQSGDPSGSDNEKIDADLARAYMNNHEDQK